MGEGNTYLKRQESSVYHSILVDTEPKVLRGVLEDKKRFPYLESKNVMFYQYGRGNNWGLGYMDSRKKKRVRNNDLDILKGNQQCNDVLRHNSIM